MSEFTVALSKIAPVYNIALTLLAYYVLVTLIVFRKKKTKTYVQPWKYLFAALTLFLIESIITALKFFDVIAEEAVPRTLNASFELLIIILFMMMVKCQMFDLEKTRKKISKNGNKTKKRKLKK